MRGTTAKRLRREARAEATRRRQFEPTFFGGGQRHYRTGFRAIYLQLKREHKKRSASS